MTARTSPGARLETFLRSGVGAVLQGKGRDGAVRRLRRCAQPTRAQPLSAGRPTLGAAPAGEPAGQGGSRSVQGRKAPPLSPPLRREGQAPPPPSSPPGRAYAWTRQGRRGGPIRRGGGSCGAEGPGRRESMLAGVDGAQTGTATCASAPAPRKGKEGWGGRRRQRDPPCERSSLPGGGGEGKVAESPRKTFPEFTRSDK